ncbi:MAG: (2Fe-2S)-binding protein [Planctomycetes bacterium]|nr:(2Fe-2S)-binding protein [Planctomycetota bacterium]
MKTVARRRQAGRGAGRRTAARTAAPAFLPHRLRLRVDGVWREVELAGAESLLDLLHQRLGVWRGAVEPLGDCTGACAVLLDGVAVPACRVNALEVAEREVTTPWAVGPGAGLLPGLREAMSRFGTPQCGRCLPGMLVTAAAYLAKIRNPTEEELRGALADHRCECAAFGPILQALFNAGVERRGLRPDALSGQARGPGAAGGGTT